jgi:hypothetical protein
MGNANGPGAQDVGREYGGLGSCSGRNELRASTDEIMDRLKTSKHNIFLLKDNKNRSHFGPK